MLFLLFVQSLFQFGGKEGIWEGYYGEQNYLDMSFYRNLDLKFRISMKQLTPVPTFSSIRLKFGPEQKMVKF